MSAITNRLYMTFGVTMSNENSLSENLIKMTKLIHNAAFLVAYIYFGEFFSWTVGLSSASTQNNSDNYNKEVKQLKVKVRKAYNRRKLGEH